MSQCFLDFAKAGAFNYCRPYCAKCYFRFIRDFIKPMEKSHGTLPEGGYPSDMWWHQIMELKLTASHRLNDHFHIMTEQDFHKV